MRVSIKKTMAIITSTLLVTGGIAVSDVAATQIDLLPSARAEVMSFQTGALEPSILFTFAPKNFVAMYNQLGTTSKGELLKPADGKYEVLSDVESDSIKIHFDTDANRTVIYSITFNGTQENMKIALRKTMYMVSKQAFQEANEAYDKLFAENGSDEEGIMDDTVYLEKLSDDKVRLYCIWD